MALTASLKAAQISSDIRLYQTSVQAISTRILVQSQLQVYNNGNHSAEVLGPITVSFAHLWSLLVIASTRALTNSHQPDLQGALSGFGTESLLLQAIIFSNDDSHGANINGIVNVTGIDVLGSVTLPYTHPDGASVLLGEDGLGYPPELYPNLTYHHDSNGNTQTFFDGTPLHYNSTYIIGPWATNSTFSLLSLTMAINNNTSRTEVLGWLTVVLDAYNIYDVVLSPEGLDTTGEVLLVKPDTVDNKYLRRIRQAPEQYADKQQVQFVLPPQSNATLGNRHGQRSWQSGNSSSSFSMSSFPAVVSAWASNNHAVNNAGAMISTTNEQNNPISAGYATVSNTVVDWVLIFEQSRSETESPITHLRNIVLACVFGTVGGMLLFTFPIAHFSVRPIRQLREATRKTVAPMIPESMDGTSSISSTSQEGDEENLADAVEARKEGFLAAVSRWRRGSSATTSRTRRGIGGRTFRIPGKVPERKVWVKDELTDLTCTFNEMSEELVMQYERLEEKVKERTAELEKSKKQAEVANESKTLFIANISHELKTPLNGILGLCAVCMQEDDVRKIRSTLSTIYKSGDLLLHLLTDLLTFSKNSIGQQIQIDEAEFRLVDLRTQVLSIFDKQAREGQVNLEVVFLGTSDKYGSSSEDIDGKIYGPSGTGRVRDMCLWGDKNRILQVLMNFTSNSLKFTPPDGHVTVRIRCVGVDEENLNMYRSTRNPSLQSKQSKLSKQSKHSKGSSKKAHRGRSGMQKRDSDNSVTSLNSAEGSENGNPSGSTDQTLSINVAGTTKQIPQIATRRRSTSPTPLNTKLLIFEFEVEDTGPGIPEDQQKKIFEPFVQGDLGLSKKYGGTGLGLSICAQLANLMGGSITLKSTVGVGSSFMMSIPLRFVSERASSVASSMQRAHSMTDSIVGQTLHDQPKTPKRSGSPAHGATDSLGSEGTQTLADVPRIVGFTQPYVAQEQVAVQSPKQDLKDLRKAESEAAKTGKKVRVLVAEDNKVNQEVVLRMLKLEDVYGRSPCPPE